MNQQEGLPSLNFTALSTATNMAKNSLAGPENLTLSSSLCSPSSSFSSSSSPAFIPTDSSTIIIAALAVVSSSRVPIDTMGSPDTLRLLLLLLLLLLVPLPLLRVE